MRAIVEEAGARLGLLVQLLESLPGPVAWALLLIPTWISLLTRRADVVASVFLLNVVAASGLLRSAIDAPAQIALIALAIAVYVLGQAFHDRRQRSLEGQIASRIAGLEEQIGTFCDALDRRAALVDKTAAETAHARLHPDSSKSPSPPGRPTSQTAGVLPNPGLPRVESAGPLGMPPGLKT